MQDRVNLIGAGADVTIIDGGGGEFVVVGSDNSSISGFTIKNGDYGVELFRSTSFTINRNIISNNTGPGILCLGATTTIMNNVIVSNTVHRQSEGNEVVIGAFR